MIYYQNINNLANIYFTRTYFLGLSAGIVAMSGTAVSRWAVDNTPHNTANDIATENGCPTTNAVTMVKCLQNLPPESIIRVIITVLIRHRNIVHIIILGGFIYRISTASITRVYVWVIWRTG